MEDELRTLQAKYDALEASSNETIRKLLDENESLAEGNDLLQQKINEYEQKFGPLHEHSLGIQTVASTLIPDDLLIPGSGLSLIEHKTLSEVHVFGNLLCVSVHSLDAHLVLSGGVDKQIVLHDWQNSTKLCSFPVNGPLLSIAFNPQPKYADYFVVCLMDATHIICRLKRDASNTDLFAIEQIASFHDHSRPGAMKIAWSNCGTYFATGSCDKSLNIYKCENLDADDIESVQCTKLKSFYFNGQVEALAFIPATINTEREDEQIPEHLVISVRSDCYLHYVNFETFEKERFNMNTDGIEHVSYTILDLRVSPSGKYLLAATDSSRHMIFKVKSNIILRNFYGHVAGNYSQPRVVWHPSEKYVISNTEESGRVFVWEIASEQLIQELVAHEALVRDLTLTSFNNEEGCKVITVSYDKTMKVWLINA